MTVLKALEMRRSYYNIDKNIKVSEKEIEERVQNIIKLIPDAYNIESQRAILVMGEKQNQLWDKIYDVFNGQVDRAKIDGFKNGYGTVLFFTDTKVVKAIQEEIPLYADKFEHFTTQSIGMLEIITWLGLRELGLGASLQHYNPVIDEEVKKMFNVPEHFKLDAQLVFGNIVEEPEAKEKMNISEKFRIEK